MSRISEFAELHLSIKRVEEKYLNFVDRISRNAWLEYIENVDVMLGELKNTLEAIGYYANPEHYESRVSLNTPTGERGPGVLADKGDKARAALESFKKKFR